MLAAAFAAAAAAAVTGSAWLGLGAGIAVAAVLALVHGFACVTHHGNQVVSRHRDQHLAAGPDHRARHRLVPAGRPDAGAGAGARFGPIALPGAAALRRRAGPRARSIADVVSGHNLLVYLAAARRARRAWVVYRTRFGLRLRAVGENPHAVDTAGISVRRHALPRVLIAGVLCRLAGAYLSIAAQRASSATCRRARATSRSPR